VEVDSAPTGGGGKVDMATGEDEGWMNSREAKTEGEGTESVTADEKLQPANKLARSRMVIPNFALIVSSIELDNDQARIQIYINT
jgi:hypothetical protein